LANAQIFGFPIVYSNEGFSKLVGYSRAEMMQKPSNLQFMHGAMTEQETISKINRAFMEHVKEQAEILLYKKNSKETINSITEK